MVSKLQNKDGRKVKKQTNNGIRLNDGVYAPEEPRAMSDKVVSISVTEETPVVDVLMELARMSGTNIQIDPTIVGGVNLNFKDVPLEKVFRRICGLTDIRFRQRYGVLVFERDIPYTKIYTLDFLDVKRDIASSITVNTSGLSSAKTGGGTSTVTTNSTDTFWDDIVKDITQIIQTTENTNKIYTQTAERIQRVIKDEEEESKMQQDINNGVYNDGMGFKKTGSKIDVRSNITRATLSDDIIRLNKRAGMITITASTKSHLLIEEYIEKLKRKVTAQVLIEMRFLEIKLSKTYKAGINWNKISALGGTITSPNGFSSTVTGLTSFTMNKGIDAVASLLEEFGSTRTLSNPRINAINNQPAMMTLATNYVYFKSKMTYTPSQYNSSGYTTPAYKNVESEAQTMPLGIIMSVLPSIDIDKREVMLNIRPTISKLDSTVKDPSVSVVIDETGNSADEEISAANSIPVANVRELDTILKLKDGQTAIIGGFTERNSAVTESGVPVLRSIPIAGNLFANKQDNTTSTETILLVKATIVDNGKKMSEYEKGVYDSFSDDPRMNEV